MLDRASEARIRELRRFAEHAISQRDYDKAEALLAEGLHLDSNDAVFLSSDLDLCLQRKQWRKAGRAYAKLLEKHPERERETWGRLANSNEDGTQLFANVKNRGILYGNSFGIVGLFAAVVGFVAASWTGAVTAFAALACIVVLAECGYRLWLYRRRGIKGERHAFPEKAPADGLFSVLSAANYVYHPVRGFDLVPNTQFVRVAIANGRVVEAHRCTSDANGNVGFTDEESDAGSVNVVILGDSFTNYPANGAAFGDLEGTEWPFYLKQHLAAAGLKNVRVLNYARSGHGILQMADTAVSVLEKHKPDIVVFAFIMRDITRQRYWYQTRSVGGVLRGLRTNAMGSTVSLDLCADQDLIDNRVTWEWAQARLSNGDSDELLEDFTRRYEKIRRRTSARAVDLLSSSRLYAWDRLFFGTPFIDFDTRPSRRISLSKMTEQSYRHDTQFLDAVTRIQASGAKIVLLHLPLPGELISGKMKAGATNDAGLLQDLINITGEEIWTMFVKVSPGKVREKYARRPYDGHPSAWTQNLFGMAFAHLILKTKLRSHFERSADHAGGGVS